MRSWRGGCSGLRRRKSTRNSRNDNNEKIKETADSSHAATRRFGMTRGSE
jgi:hypothetical protein